MQTLFLFLYNYRGFLLFVFLELVCIWLIVRNNHYQGAAILNSANRLTGSLLESSDNVSGYFNLQSVNQQLARENAALKHVLYNRQDSLFVPGESLPVNDTLATKQYRFIPAKVINNSTSRFNNYITLNIGSDEGVVPGMGVLGTDGVVGRVKAVSKNYSTVISLLHTDLLISSVIKNSAAFGSTRWDGRDSRQANLHYIPRHVDVRKGDSIVTSGYNALFPPGISVGTISEVNIQENATFFEIKIDLSTDFSRLSFVYLVENFMKQEKDSLEQQVLNPNE